MARKPKAPKSVESIVHDDAKRKNIPSAELQSLAQRMEEADPVKPVTYERQHPLAEGETRERDGDLDPQIIWKGAKIELTDAQIEQLRTTGTVTLADAQLVWRGKDTQDWSDLVVQAPPIYVQEKVHPKVIIEDLKRQTKERAEEAADAPDMFADFNGIDPEAKTEFYQHDMHWQNRMILGDSLQAMASLAEREGLRGKVQCIYFDPPYGIKFNSNWQVSTRSRDVKDGKLDQITREPEQVKAFRDTWKDGIHSYLTYLRDRLTVMRDMLTESGSIFVQIGDENVHRVRALLDEVFGEENFVSEIRFQKTSSATTNFLPSTNDAIVWYSKKKEQAKFRRLNLEKSPETQGAGEYVYSKDAAGQFRRLSSDELRDSKFAKQLMRVDNLTSQSGGDTTRFEYMLEGRSFRPGSGGWKTSIGGMERLDKSDRLHIRSTSMNYVRYLMDHPVLPLSDYWWDTAIAGWSEDKSYVVQTARRVIQRCILMATDPGDLVLDPTCGSGTTATVAEQWGRRWITMDTSRVALALARTRLMAARYPYYHLADSAEGRAQEQKVSGNIQPDTPTQGDIRQGFVYKRAPHIMLRSITNNAEIDVIWENWQQKLEPLREQLNAALGRTGPRKSPAETGKDGPWEEWEIPREADEAWSDKIEKIHTDWWDARIARQTEIDASIAQKADVEMLYDRPYEDKNKVRVAGPFTVESLSPHRMIPADEDDSVVRALLDGEDNDVKSGKVAPRHTRDSNPEQDFAQMVLENLKAAGLHQGAKEDRIEFDTIEGWPGDYIGAVGTYNEGSKTRRAAIFIGPEFGTITDADLTAAAREANDSRFDALIACGFAYDALTTDRTKLGPLPILKARMNPDLHMSGELKNTGAGNLFVIFGEPDVEWKFDTDGKIVVEMLGVDVFDPKSGDIRASGKDDIAAWFIDTDYNEESFFVRHAYFMGANDPYKSLKTALKDEIDKEAWETLYRDTSRPFEKPETGRFAVKVINHFGDEVMKVFGV
jgi:adenine-specific DNA-methyltransferase